MLQGKLYLVWCNSSKVKLECKPICLRDRRELVHNWIKFAPFCLQLALLSFDWSRSDLILFQTNLIWAFKLTYMILCRVVQARQLASLEDSQLQKCVRHKLDGQGLRQIHCLSQRLCVVFSHTSFHRILECICKHHNWQGLRLCEVYLQMEVALIHTLKEK